MPSSRAAQTVSPTSPTAPVWRKILYQPQPFPDNYFDATVLRGLRRRSPPPPPPFAGLVHSALALTQQLSVLVFFAVVYSTVAAQPLLEANSRGGDGAGSVDGAPPAPTATPAFRLLVAINAGLSGAGLCTLLLLRSTLVTGLAGAASLAKSCGLFVGVLYLMSPVLKSLTTSYADNAIVLMAVCLGAVHLYVHDYSRPPPPAKGRPDVVYVAGTVSFNAAIFVSVLLASRLASTALAFAFLLFALQIFAFLPQVLRVTRRVGGWLHAAVTAALVAGTLASLPGGAAGGAAGGAGAGVGRVDGGAGGGVGWGGAGGEAAGGMVMGGGVGGAWAAWGAWVGGGDGTDAGYSQTLPLLGRLLQALVVGGGEGLVGGLAGFRLHAAGYWYLAAVGLVNVVGPAALIAVHGWKRPMDGPWDIRFPRHGDPLSPEELRRDTEEWRARQRSGAGGGGGGAGGAGSAGGAGGAGGAVGGKAGGGGGDLGGAEGKGE